MKTSEKMNHPSSRAKRMLYLVMLTAGVTAMDGQQLYDNFESGGVVSFYVPRAAQLETLAPNPNPDQVNSSEKCARFSRSRQRYDYIKIYPSSKLESVQSYATYEWEAPKIKMKVYTTAPPGSTVEIQLGKKEGNAYPEGVHSQYQAITSVKGAWEELEFHYAVSPKGSETRASQVDQITLLFNPNSNTTHLWYFDDIQGPALSKGPSARAQRRKKN
jgi:hypothetical protein